ncbi:MAG: 50S ribosomal protein L24e [Candidatus Aenigmatarchaeota archaeon]
MKCSFCGRNVIESRGKMFVKTTGEIFYFCNSKCEKNFMMGREAKKIKWVRKRK